MAVEIATPIRALTIEEYLELEHESTVKHEFVGGELFAFAGASDRHNRLALRIARRLDEVVADGPCRVYISDMKLQVAEDAVYYPDVMVVCDPDDDDDYVKTNPVLVAEVLSPTTRQVDLREKLLNYRRLPRLQTYLIVFQDDRRVIRHWRDDEGAWRLADVSDQGRVPIPYLEVELTLDEIYAGILPEQ